VNERHLKKIPHFIEQIFKIKDGWFPCVLCGNKSDVSSREVSADEAKSLADKFQFPYVECSAKTRANIEEVFFEAVRGALWYKNCVVDKIDDHPKPKWNGFSCILL